MEISYLSLFIVTVAGICLFAVGAVSGSCTSTAIHKSKMCTANLTSAGTIATNTFFSQGDAEKVIQACGNGDLLTAINCMERVVEDCKNDNTDAAHYLRSMIDIEKARRSVNYFCTNVRVYAVNAVCIARHLKDQDICAQEGKKNYETQASATSNMDTLMKFQCKLYSVVVNCADKVVASRCSSDAANLVRTVLDGFEPPVCSAVRETERAERTGTFDSSHSNKAKGLTSTLIQHLLLFVISSMVVFS